MYTNVPLIVAILMLVGGLYFLAKSSDIFIDGSAELAYRFRISPMIVGMVIIGLGTSAPELCVSVLSGIADHTDLSIGNAYGSCTFNIAAILGITALVRPIRVKKTIVTVGVPLLILTALLSIYLLSDYQLTRTNALVLLAVFFVLLPGYCWFDQKNSTAQAITPPKVQSSFWRSLIKVVAGLVILIASSHFLVWGAVDIARACGVSDLLIGLTIVGIGTSLPELASAIQSARKGEDEFILGNIIGSNFFNTLAVVGAAGAISPSNSFSHYILYRDLPMMIILSIMIGVFGVRKSREQNGLITRSEGLVWVVIFMAYLVLLIVQEFALCP